MLRLVRGTFCALKDSTWVDPANYALCRCHDDMSRRFLEGHLLEYTTAPLPVIEYEKGKMKPDIGAIAHQLDITLQEASLGKVSSTIVKMERRERFLAECIFQDRTDDWRDFFAMQQSATIAFNVRDTRNGGSGHREHQDGAMATDGAGSLTTAGWSHKLVNQVNSCYAYLSRTVCNEEEARKVMDRIAKHRAILVTVHALGPGYLDVLSGVIRAEGGN